MTTDITLRRNKSQPLTFDEVDDNFENLKATADSASGDLTTLTGRVDTIEGDYTTAAQAETIADAAVSAHVALPDPHAQYLTDAESVSFAATKAAADTLAAGLADGATVLIDEDETADPVGVQTRRTVTGGVLSAIVSFLKTGMIAWKHGGTGAVWRTLYARLMDLPISVKDFGAVLDGVANDRPAFVLADTYALSIGASLDVPGLAHIATPLTLSSPLVDTLRQIFTDTSDVVVANKTCIRPEWWGAKQGQESTLACRQAVKAIANGGIMRLSGNYYLSGVGSELLLIDRPLTIQGIGAPRSGFIVLDGDIGASTDYIRVSPDMTKSDGEGYHFYDFGITSANPTQGRHAFNLDISASGQRLKNVYIHRAQTSRVGGNGIRVTNPIPNIDSVFTTSIRDCVIRNGIYMINAGDSLRIVDSTLTGENYGVWLQLIFGANAPLISGCNITNKSGAVYVYGPTNPIIVYNNIEALLESDSAEKAFIVFTGDNAGVGPLVNPPRKAIIDGNIFGMLADGATPRVTRGVFMYQGDGCIIGKNQFNRALPASQTAYVIGALCRRTAAHLNDISGATHQDGYTDNGQSTIGTIRPLGAYNAGYQFFTSGGNWQSPRYTKDANRNVLLSGAIALDGGAWTDGTVIFTLPVGYRPRLLKTFSISAFQTAVGYVPVFLRIAGNGDVSLLGVTGKALEWVNYDGVAFMNYEE